MILVEMTYGSHLYGTATPASDIDYKGVGLAAPRDVLLGRIPKVLLEEKPKKAPGTKNAPGEVDRQIFSLHNFIHMALKGETVSVDMLHASPHHCLQWSSPWAELVANRHRFYTRNMVSLVGYARGQAAKYGLRGSRLAAAKAAISALSQAEQHANIGAWQGRLFFNEHASWHAAQPQHNNLAMYEVCGMKFQETARVAYVISRLQVFVDRYGARAQLAEQNLGVDWKAISHAFRAAYQMRAILTQGGFTYPLAETDFLIKVKRGEYTYSEVGPQLEDTIDEVERLAEVSALPVKPDTEWAENFLANTTRASLDSRV